MSERGKYPLEAARVLRAQEEDAALRALAEASRAHEEALAARLRLRTTLHAHRAETDDVAAEERARDARGRGVAEMVRAQEWLAHRAREQRELVRREADAHAREQEARAAMERAQSALASAKAARDAVEKHHAAWLEGQKRERERREDDEADERARRRS